MKSFKDIKYRNYVLKQLRMKKAQIESIIRKQQEELNVLEATMENIMDGKCQINLSMSETPKIRIF